MNAATVTHNPTCDAIRTAHRKVKAEAWSLKPDELHMAVMQAEAAQVMLREAYKIVARHPTLSVQCETAGKSVRNLVLSLQARQQGTAP